MFTSPGVPFLVWTITTPLAARDPYIAAAAASFSTCIDSISDGLTLFKSPGEPSIITNGLLLPKELDPLILILIPAPGAPLEGVTLTPGAVPSSARPALGNTAFF